MTRHGIMSRIRAYLLTGLLVLAPTAITLYVFYRLINWMDNLLGRYLRFEAFDYNRIPGAGLLATVLLLGLVGWIATRFGSGPVSDVWDSFMSRIPGIGIVYGSTKSLGEAFLSKKEQAFKKVVLVPWPLPGSWRLGFIMGRVSDEVRAKLPADVEVVFIPHTPNPASGFVHYVLRSQIVELDWPVEDGLRVIVSGGVVQPGSVARLDVAPPPPPAETSPPTPLNAPDTPRAAGES
jgi:uncharacterized membrane protein